MKKLCLAAITAIYLCIGTAAPVMAQQSIVFCWKVEQYDNGYKFYYCNGSTAWSNQDEPPGTLIAVHEDPTVCH